MVEFRADIVSMKVSPFVILGVAGQSSGNDPVENTFWISITDKQEKEFPLHLILLRAHHIQIKRVLLLTLEK